MRFSRFAGVSIIPVIARLVLAAAFIPAGLHKIKDQSVFQGEMARVLTDLGIGEQDVAMAGATVRLVSMQEETGTGTDTDTDADADADTDADTDAGADAGATEDGGAAGAGADTPVVPVRARALHGVTALLVMGGWPAEWKPHWMAWLAGITELLGGVLLLVGFFSRIWGLGLATAMGFAFWLTSMSNLGEPGLFTMAAGIEGAQDPFAMYNRLVGQLGLFVLAFGVLLTGPGPLSVDRLLFKRRGHEVQDLELEPVPPAPTPARVYRPEPTPAPAPKAEPEDDGEEEDQSSATQRPL
jgi:uncharacterized membrane protein YphA (DoxX/SURF4 family)